MAGSNLVLLKPRIITEQNSLNLQVEEIYRLIKSAKRNKQYIKRFVAVIKQITQALSGADANFLRNAEFYQDLRETLNKIQTHLATSAKRKPITRLLMAKKDEITYEEMQKHVDTLCGRIFLSYAHRMEQRATVSNKSIHRM